MLRERRRAANNKPNRRLDRKSSRGMIFENEELRMRTININAEVERGQSDIRKLRRENEHLRREIWALRDEYDRLDKLLSGKTANNNNNKTNNTNSSNPPSGGSSDGSSTASGTSDGSVSSDGESENNSCDENEAGEKLNETTDCNEMLDNNKNLQKSTIVNHNGIDHHQSAAPHYSSLLKNRDNLHVNFDHLSIVSEETLTSTPNSPTSPTPEFLNELLSARHLAPIDPISTLTPLNELQSVQPPLYHFENLSYETLGPSIDANGQILKPPQLIAPSKLNLLLNSKTKPKVFFGPMRPSPSIESLKKPDQPLYATIKKSQKLTLPTSSGTATAFQNGGNLEDLLKEITLNPIEDDDIHDSMQPDIVAIEGDKLECKPVSPYNPRKHRSQINLVLNYDGTKPNEISNNREPSPISLSTTPTSIESSLENRLNKIGFEKFTNGTSRPEHIYSTVDTPPPKIGGPPQFNGGLNCNGNGLNITPDKSLEKLPPVIDVKRKSRRVSLCFNGRKTAEAKQGRRASIDVVSIEKNLADFSNSTTPFQRRHSTNLNQHHNNPHHKSSHDSIKIVQSLQSIAKSNGTDGNVTSASETNGRRSMSRESTSSIVTQKSRKVSASSQSGKIPWCACWGNGCF